MAHPGDVRPEDVQTELTDILGQVVGSAPDAVVDQAVLADLGVDSLAIVEVADELGRRFDVYIPDEAVNEIRTVSDAVDAVVRHEGNASQRRTTAYAFMAAPSSTDAVEPDPEPDTTAHHAAEVIDPEKRKSAFRRLAWWFAGVGAVVGIVFGLGGAALVAVTGLTSSDLPPLVAPTTPAPSTATPTPTPTPTSDPEATPDPDPTLTIPTTDVEPGERFTLEGAFPALDEGETLQVQVKDPGARWDKFPVTATTKEGGSYRTEIYTSRTGERKFRVIHRGSDTKTPAVQVKIG